VANAAGNRVGPARRIRGLAAVIAVALAGAIASGCGAGETERSAPAATAVPQAVRLDVLVYNIEYEGGPKTDAVIRQLDADVVGVLESYDRLPEIARKTGYRYYNTSLQLLSRYPILEASGAGGLYGLIEVAPGYVIPFFNVHLDYVAWGPRRLKKGHSVADVIASENRVRTSAMQRPFAAMRRLRAEGYPIFLTGDFNQPSSLDYTAATAGSRPEIPAPVAWPVSEALFDLGFRDSYRETHPDPRKDPGITQESSGERIDYVYAAGPSTTVASKLVGERGGEDVEIVGNAKWTSDHRAVLSTFDVTPMAMPTLVAVSKRLGTVGSRFTVTYNAPGSTGGEIAVVAHGGDAEPRTTLAAPGGRGTARFATKAWKPGRYDVVLSGSAGAEVARVPFVLRGPRARLRVSTDRRTYARGRPIRVSWRRAPVNRWDWLGVYKASAQDPAQDDYLIWQYAAGHSAGTVPPKTHGHATLGAGSQGKPWPLPPGDYVVHYLLADQYDSAAKARFRVSE
jgi:endonuclease/exonuclease/phosphatase family metal-dependent hydrolase